MTSVFVKKICNGKLEELRVIDIEEEMDDYKFYSSHSIDWKTTITATGFRAVKNTERYCLMYIYELLSMSMEYIAIAIDSLNKCDRV